MEEPRPRRIELIDLPEDDILLEECATAEEQEREQELVTKFLDGEIDFNDYIDNIASADESEENELKSEPAPSSSFSNFIEEQAPVFRVCKRKSTKLSPALKGLMGEANLRFARDDKDTAVKICLEIIRQVPSAPEPFHTLAAIYEETGDFEKYLQMSLIAAHLGPTDLDQWVELADLSLSCGNIKQAISCLTRAINLDLFNLTLHGKRAELLEELGDKKSAVKGYIRVLQAYKPEEGNEVISLAKFIAELCHKQEDYNKANEVLDLGLRKCPSFVNHEYINLHLDLLLLTKDYKRCLEILVEFCGLSLEAETTLNVISITSCRISSSTPVDILTKLIIVLIHSRAPHLVNDVISPILDSNPSDVGDLYLDIVDAYSEEGFYEHADRLLHILVNAPSYNLPGVWLKYANNLKSLKRSEEAVSAYTKVLEQVPQHIEARMALASLLVQLEKTDEALSALEQDEQCDLLDPGLLYSRCMLLKKDKTRTHELVMVSQVLFSRHTTELRTKDELTAVSPIQRYDRKRLVVRQIRCSKQDTDSEDYGPLFRKDRPGPSPEEEWQLFKYICNICYRKKKYAILQRLTFTATLSTVFCVFKKELDVLCALAAFLNRDTFSGYNIVRTLVVKNSDNVKIWYLFNLIVTKSDDARHNRFIMRQLATNGDHPALGIIHGNNCLVSGTYKYAMYEYSTIFTKRPSALGALLLGLTYLQLAAQKFTSKKHHLVVQCLSLLSEYKELRGIEGSQEAHYNLGRSFHHIGLFYAAIEHYKKVLQLASSNPLCDKEPHIFDLSKEAAFNLYIIYSNSESYDLARMYLEKYIVI